LTGHCKVVGTYVCCDTVRKGLPQTCEIQLSPFGLAALLNPKGLSYGNTSEVITPEASIVAAQIDLESGKDLVACHERKPLT